MATCERRRRIGRFNLRRGAALFIGGVLAPSLLFHGCGGADLGGVEEDLAEEEVRDPNEPGVWEIGPGIYEVVIVAYEGGFDPSEVRVPVGSEVHFRARSADLVHGFLIEGTDVEMEIDPLDASETSYTFTEAGEYALHCHIYCGGGHPSMLGTVIVE